VRNDGAPPSRRHGGTPNLSEHVRAIPGSYWSAPWYNKQQGAGPLGPQVRLSTAVVTVDHQGRSATLTLLRNASVTRSTTLRLARSSALCGGL
jgi:hypothetical protein